MYTNMLPATGAGVGLAGWYYGYGLIALLALLATLSVVLAVVVLRKAAGR